MRLRSEVLSVARDDEGFTLELNGATVGATKLVIASGGLSMPGLGATPFGYKIAEQFGLNVLPTRAGLVPLRCISRCLTSFRCSPACLFPLSLPLRTAPYFVKTCSLRTVGCQARLFYKFPVFGSRASLSALICCQMWISEAFSMSSAARTQSEPEEHAGDAITEATGGVFAAVGANP